LRSSAWRMASLPDPRFRLLRAYYLLRRGLTGSKNPDTRRMRRLKEAFHRRAWLDAADALGVALTSLSDGVAEIACEGERLRVCGSSISFDDPVTLQLAGDKPAVYALLAQRGIPVPPHIAIEASELNVEAAVILRSLPLPLVVKPAAGTGAGSGVSTSITTLKQLRHAAAWASAFGPRVLVESLIEGDCYRVLLMDGEVVDTVLRRPPRLVGDGVSTVQQLIVRENKLRLDAGADRAQALVRCDPDLVNTLAAQGLKLRSRPAHGRIVQLKHVINDNRAAENEQANGRLCDAILAASRRAVAALGLRLGGVDLICTDPGVPLEQSGGAIIEVNTTPSFYYHYHRVGPPFPVAEHVLRSFFIKGACGGG
jgi:D-alanine-D-alanine ligase-like ATP-grasp enzyme